MKKTGIIVLSAIALLGIWEIYVLLNNESGDTISEWFWYVSKHPVIPFIAGLLMSHFFWFRKIK